jgi:hypothetical protein
LAGFAAIERLLAADMVGDRHHSDVVEPDATTDVTPPREGEGE